MAYHLKTVYMEKSEMPAIFNEIIVFIFFGNELKEFPELGQNPSEHLKLNIIIMYRPIIIMNI